MRYPIKVLAIGAGGLQRALTHEFIDYLNKNNRYHGGIYVGQPRGTDKAEAFNQQNGIYHLVVFDLNEITEIKKVESVVGAATLSTEKGRELFLKQVENPLDLILVGVTEAGIGKGEIAMDVLHQTLIRYYEHHGSNSSISVINTDNIRHNGQVLRDIILDEYQAPTSDFTHWLENQVDFLDQMGDRIVPQSSIVPHQTQKVAIDQIGQPDDLITYTESLPVVSLVLQDTNKRLRVPFGELESLGVIVTSEPIDPFHDWKLLLVNSVHVPGITHKAFLSGIETVNEAANHPKFAPHIEVLMTGYAELVSKDIPIPGRSALEYTMDFVHRIRRIEDTNARINVNETVKLRERAVDIVVSPNYAKSSSQFHLAFAYSFATVLRFLTPATKQGDTYFGQTDTGEKYPISDPNRVIQQALSGAFGQNDASRRLESILSNTDLWSSPGATTTVNLSQNRCFVDQLIPFYHQLTNGMTCLELLAKLI